MEPRRRVLMVLAVLATIAVFAFLARVAGSPSMALLYAGLDPKAAAEVVAALERRGTPFELRGQAIYVPSGERDGVRLALAGENLPASGTAGYELLDTLPGFSTTAEMFDATYWRAKEGELARTLLAGPGMRAARVHIANPVRRPFDREGKPSASVILTASTGAVDPARALAARHLVASAVAGLRPENVTVIDSVAGVLLKAGDAGPGTLPDAQGRDRAAEIRERLGRLLAARVGDGRAIVEVNVDTVTESETISERVIDPSTRVAIAQDSEEKSENQEGTGPGGVTIASNLPDPAATAPPANAKRSSTATRARTNFEVSEVRRERVKLPGDVKRISVAVLVDGIATVAADGTRTWAPRPEAEIQQLAQLVRSAIGFDEARGDVVTVTSLEFSPAPVLGTVAETGFGDLLAVNAMTLIQLGVLAVVALVLGLFVLRPMLSAAPPVALPGPGDLPADAAGTALLAGPGGLEATIEAAGELLEANPETVARLSGLRETISQRTEEAAVLLKSWLETEQPGEEPA